MHRTHAGPPAIHAQRQLREMVRDLLTDAALSDDAE
jgi:hypothetical protein